MAEYTVTNFSSITAGDTLWSKIHSLPAYCVLTTRNIIMPTMSTSARLFMTVDALLVSLSFGVAAIFLLEGSPGPLTTEIGIFGKDLSYLLFGPDQCDLFVCYSDLNSLPSAKSRTSIKGKIEYLGNFDNITTCEQACVNHKVSNLDYGLDKHSHHPFVRPFRFFANEASHPDQIKSNQRAAHSTATGRRVQGERQSRVVTIH
jgi:hypothetical protein